MKEEQEQSPRASCPALHRIPEIHVASTVDFCIARSSEMQGTTTTNIKNQELCCWGCLWLHSKQAEIWARWGCPPPSDVHPKEPLQSSLLHVERRPRKCLHLCHITSNHCWLFCHFERPGSALILCFIHGQQEPISFITEQEHIQLNWQTILHFPITSYRTSFRVKRSPEVIEILGISFSDPYMAESVISIWISWDLLLGLFVVRCHWWWCCQRGWNIIDSKGPEVKGNEV